MDFFVQSLSINANLTVEDAAKNCMKIFKWLIIISEGSNLSYKDVETILKTAIYFKECILLFGVELKNELISIYPDSKIDLERNYKYFESKNLIPYVCAKIFKTMNGYKHLYVVDIILKNLTEKDNPLNIDKILANCHPQLFNNEFNNNQQKLYVVLQRIFQLPEKQIEIALERTLNTISFNILGFIFVESKESIYFDKCLILEQKICQLLENCKIKYYFLYTMFITISLTRNGLLFYWKCLENQVFAYSLATFLTKFLSSLILDDENDDNYSNDKNLQKYNVEEIYFLTYSALAIESPFRPKFYKILHNSNINDDILRIINKMAFVYD